MAASLIVGSVGLATCPNRSNKDQDEGDAAECEPFPQIDVHLFRGEHCLRQHDMGG